jgi:hypothetical protein
MAIYNYALLALLASGAHGVEGSTLTLGSDAIVQPKGGASVLLAEMKQSLKKSYQFDSTNSGSSRKHIGQPKYSAPVNPALQGGNMLQKEGGGVGSPIKQQGYDLKANKKF